MTSTEVSPAQTGQMSAPISIHNPYAASVLTDESGSPASPYSTYDGASWGVSAQQSWSHGPIESYDGSQPMVEHLSIHHRELWGRCYFATLPEPSAPTSVVATGKSTPHRLFFGQIKREVTPMQMRWLIRRACGVIAVSVESRSAGCFYACARTAEDAEAMRRIHKRILFDLEGIWIARDDAEASAMAEYVEAAGATFPLHLPKSCVVVEEPRLSSRKSKKNRKKKEDAAEDEEVEESGP